MLDTKEFYKKLNLMGKKGNHYLEENLTYEILDKKYYFR